MVLTRELLICRPAVYILEGLLRWSDEANTKDFCAAEGIWQVPEDLWYCHSVLTEWKYYSNARLAALRVWGQGRCKTEQILETSRIKKKESNYDWHERCRRLAAKALSMKMLMQLVEHSIIVPLFVNRKFLKSEMRVIFLHGRRQWTCEETICLCWNRPNKTSSERQR